MWSGRDVDFGVGGGGVRLGVGGMGGFDQGEISEMFFSMYAF